MNKENLLKLPMQFFAEEEEPDTPQPEGGEEETPKQFSQEELDEIIQERLRRQQKKHEEELRKVSKEEKRLAQLSEEDRREEEARQNAEELRNAQAQLRKIEMERDTHKILSEANLPLDFTSFLMGEDEEQTNENIKNFRSLFDSEVQKAVEERLKGKTPSKGSNSLGGTTTGNQANHISDLAKKHRLI